MFVDLKYTYTFNQQLSTSFITIEQNFIQRIVSRKQLAIVSFHIDHTHKSLDPIQFN